MDQLGLYDLFLPFAKGALQPVSGPNDQNDGTTTGWDTARVRAGLATRPAVFVCPSDTAEPMLDLDAVLNNNWDATIDYAIGSYSLVSGTNGPSYGISFYKVKMYNNGMFRYKTVRRQSDVTDGLSHTMVAGEAIDGHTGESLNIWWMGGRLQCLRSTDNPLNTPPGQGIVMTMYGFSTNGAFMSYHPNGAHFAFGDGHVSFLHENIDLATYRALSTIAGGEHVESY